MMLLVVFDFTHNLVDYSLALWWSSVALTEPWSVWTNELHDNKSHESIKLILPTKQGNMQQRRLYN